MSRTFYWKGLDLPESSPSQVMNHAFPLDKVTCRFLWSHAGSYGHMPVLMVMCHPRSWKVTWFPMVTCIFLGSCARGTNIQ